MKLLEKYPIAVLLLISLTTIIFLWGDIFWNPNDYLFAPYGDGMKNYYVSAYYIKYGSGLSFEGMGYPYSSYLLYADAMPILSIPLQWCSEYLFDVENYIVGIINLMMILSVIPCALFLYLILRHYRVSIGYALITSLLIAHLSPQFHRVLGHFALSIMAFVPIVWFLLLKQSEVQKTYFWAFLQIIALLVFTFIHAYYLLIGAVFILAYALVYFLQNHFRKQINWRYLGSLLVTVIVPIIAFKVFQIATDPTIDMHTSPYGFFVYHAEPRTILFSKEPPLVEFWKLFYTKHNTQFEGYAYIGFVAVLAVIFTLIKGFKYTVKRQWSKITHPVLPKNLMTAIWASVIVLLYSMCFPFEQGFGFVLEYLPQLQQFRSLGRFAWVFYYVFTVYTAFYFYLIFRRMSIQGLRKIALTMLFLLFGLWAMEGYYMIQSKKDYVIGVNKENHDFYGKTINYKDILNQKGYKVDDFQAIMAFPYFNIGSEKIYVTERGSGGMYLSCKVSYQTGLPINSIYIGRYPISRAMKMGQLMSSPIIKKEVLADYSNDKPLLLVTHGKNIAPDEQRILNQAKLIYNKENEAMYELPLSAFKDEQKIIKQQFAAQKDTLNFHVSHQYWSTDSIDNTIINDFEEEGNHSNALLGSKAIYQSTGELVLFEGKLPNATNNQVFIASVWIQSDNKHAAFPDFSYKQFNTENAVIDQIYFDPKDRLDIYKNWVRADHVFTIRDNNNPIKISLVGDNITADELLIKPLPASVYYNTKADTTFIFNGYIIQ